MLEADSKTVTVINWAAAPLTILISMPVFAILGLFGDGRFLVVFALITIPSLLVWRWSTFRLDPSFENLREIDDANRELVASKIIPLYRGYAVVTAILGCVLFGMLLLPPKSYDLLSLIIAIYIWMSIIKLGVFNVVCSLSIPEDRNPVPPVKSV